MKATLHFFVRGGRGGGKRAARAILETRSLPYNFPLRSVTSAIFCNKKLAMSLPYLCHTILHLCSENCVKINRYLSISETECAAAAGELRDSQASDSDAGKKVARQRTCAVEDIGAQAGFRV